MSRQPTDWSDDKVPHLQPLDVVLFQRKGLMAKLKRWWHNNQFDEAAIMIEWNGITEVARMHEGRLQYYCPLSKWPGFITSEGLKNRKVINLKANIKTPEKAMSAVGKRFSSSFHAVAFIFGLTPEEGADEGTLLTSRILK